MSVKKKVFDLLQEEEERAIEVYRKSIVIDGVHVPNVWDDRFDEWLHRMNKAGITASPQSVCHTHSTVQLLRNLSECLRRIDKNNDVVVGPVTSAEEIEKAKKDGKTAILFHLHNALCLEPNLYLETIHFPGWPVEMEFPHWLLEIYHKLGVTVIQIVRNLGNLLGSGCGERVDYGLTKYGVAAVEAMNRLGIVIDLSHAGDQTTMEAIEMSKDPIVCTHANASSLYPGKFNRNKTDEQIKAMAEKGGVIGACIWWPSVKGGPAEEVSIEDWYDHIDYMVDLVGADHVGFAADWAPFWSPRLRPNNISPRKDISGEISNWAYEPTKTPWRGFPDRVQPPPYTCVAETPAVAKGLVARGYSDQEIEKILGANFLRVFKRVFGK